VLEKEGELKLIKKELDDARDSGDVRVNELEKKYAKEHADIMEDKKELNIEKNKFLVERKAVYEKLAKLKKTLEQEALENKENLRPQNRSVSGKLDSGRKAEATRTPVWQAPAPVVQFPGYAPGYDILGYANWASRFDVAAYNQFPPGAYYNYYQNQGMQVPYSTPQMNMVMQPYTGYSNPQYAQAPSSPVSSTSNDNKENLAASEQQRSAEILARAKKQQDVGQQAIGQQAVGQQVQTAPVNTDSVDTASLRSQKVAAVPEMQNNEFQFKNSVEEEKFLKGKRGRLRGDRVREEERVEIEELKIEKLEKKKNVAGGACAVTGMTAAGLFVVAAVSTLSLIFPLLLAGVAALFAGGFFSAKSSADEALRVKEKTEEKLEGINDQLSDIRREFAKLDGQEFNAYERYNQPGSQAMEVA
jgi:hypothetical protein